MYIVTASSLFYVANQLPKIVTEVWFKLKLIIWKGASNSIENVISVVYYSTFKSKLYFL